jgi:hypothetical protein
MDDDFLIFMALLIAGVTLIAPVLIVVLFVQLSGAKSRIGRLEDVAAQLVAEVKRLRERGGTAAPIVAPQALADQPLTLPAVAQPEVRPVAPEPVAPEPVQLRQDLAAPPVAPKLAAAAPDQNQPLVFRPDRFEAALIWLRDNWAYAVAAPLLAMMASPRCASTSPRTEIQAQRRKASTASPTTASPT